MKPRIHRAGALLPLAIALSWFTPGGSQGGLQVGASPAIPPAAPPRGLDLHQLMGLERHEGPALPSCVWIEQGRAYLQRERRTDGDDGDWIRTETRSGKHHLWLRAAALVPGPSDRDSAGGPASPLKVVGYELSPDGRWVLLQTGRVKRWRRSHTAVHWVYDRRSRTLRRLTGAELAPQIHAHFSPDGARIGFVSGGNLYAVDSAGGPPRALTGDATATVRNGDPDWVYEEELDFKRAWWWSPDGKFIAYLRFDDAEVPEVPLIRYGDDSYPALESLRYPKAGAPNPKVTLHVVDVANAHSALVGGQGVGTWHYFTRVAWRAPHGGIVWDMLDRAQRSFGRYRRRISYAALRDSARWASESGVVGDETRAAQWYDPESGFTGFDADGAGGELWVTERAGWRHLHYRAGDGQERELTSGSWDVTGVYGVDPRSRTVLVQTTRGGPLTRELALVPLDGGEPQTVGGAGGWHEASLAPDGRHFIETVSSFTQRPRMLLRRIDGSVVRALTTDPMEDLAGIDLGQARFVTVPIEDESGARVELNGQLLLPPAFDPQRRYPAVIYCYGGPGSQIVCDKWGGKRMLFHRRLAEDGIVVFLLDNRGTGGRGAAFMKQVYGRLGQLEAADQLAGAHWLVQQAFVDPGRIAIWGWSYGGYLAGLTLLRGEGAIAAGACVAPVVDWRFYDSVYTERYMGLPAQNQPGYDAASLLTYAKELQGRLLLVHGTADDNVHAQNTLRLAAALEQAGKPFELMVYPDKAHGLDGKRTQEHVYRLLRDFFLRAFGMQSPADTATTAGDQAGEAHARSGGLR